MTRLQADILFDGQNRPAAEFVMRYETIQNDCYRV